MRNLRPRGSGRSVYTDVFTASCVKALSHAIAPRTPKLELNSQFELRFKMRLQRAWTG